jgi:tripartite-type tricarboxylate transporter receptor subunit TctC
MTLNLFRTIATFVLSLSVFSSYADTVPLIIQTGPGGLNHKYALELEPVLTKILDAPVIIEFKPGGQGIVGARALASNKNSSMSLMLGAVQQDFAIDQTKDIVPVLDLGIAPTVLIAKPSLGISSLSQLTKTSRSYTVGIPNGAAQLYWVREFAKNYKNLNLIEVPYKSGAAVITDVIGGHVDIGIASAIGAAPLIQENKVIVLATLSTKRSTLIPIVPTAKEQGIVYKKDTVGFSHMYIWANPGASVESIQKLKSSFYQWANTREAIDLFQRIDLGVDIQVVAKPELSLQTYIQEK